MLYTINIGIGDHFLWLLHMYPTCYKLQTLQAAETDGVLWVGSPIWTEITGFYVTVLIVAYHDLQFFDSHVGYKQGYNP